MGVEGIGDAFATMIGCLLAAVVFLAVSCALLFSVSVGWITFKIAGIVLVVMFVCGLCIWIGMRIA